MKVIIKKQFSTKYHGGKLGKYNGIVLHHTAGSNGGDYKILSGKSGREVSVHFWVPDYDDDNRYDADGNLIVYQFLPLTTAGWHTGKAVAGWGNSNTIGIEIGNLGTKKDKFETEQLMAIDFVIKYIDKKMGVNKPIRSHADIALPKGRKTDPNPTTFKWLNNYKKYRQHNIPVIKPQESVKQPVKAVKVINGPLYLKKPMMTGKSVRLVQKRIGAKVDGIFGPATKSHVVAFQRSKKLKADGIVGPATAKAMGYNYK